MRELSRTLGAGPWFLRERGVFPNQVYRGEPSTTALAIAIGYAGDMQIEIIQPTAQETASFHQLPKVRHKDPFDRMLVCQAIAHGLVVLTPDQAISRYPVRVHW
jgi:hypothetical protein